MFKELSEDLFELLRGKLKVPKALERTEDLGVISKISLIYNLSRNADNYKKIVQRDNSIYILYDGLGEAFKIDTIMYDGKITDIYMLDYDMMCKATDEDKLKILFLFCKNIMLTVSRKNIYCIKNKKNDLTGLGNSLSYADIIIFISLALKLYNDSPELRTTVKDILNEFIYDGLATDKIIDNYFELVRNTSIEQLLDNSMVLSILPDVEKKVDNNE